jgi:hypothetical protein
MTIFEITAATVLALTTNAGINGKYFYNTERDNNNVVNSQTVYNVSTRDSNLTRKLKYNFTYDSQKRLQGKETLKWNSVSAQWEHYSMLNFSYDSNGCALSLAYWNGRTKAYSDMEQKYSYSEIGDNLVEVATYTWNKETKAFELANRDVMYNPSGDDLMARWK